MKSFLQLCLQNWKKKWPHYYCTSILKHPSNIENILLPKKKTKKTTKNPQKIKQTLFKKTKTKKPNIVQNVMGRGGGRRLTKPVAIHMVIPCKLNKSRKCYSCNCSLVLLILLLITLITIHYNNLQSKQTY